MTFHPYHDSNNLLVQVPLPDLVLLHQRFPRPHLSDIAATVAMTLEQNEIATRIAPGARIAIGVGSRGVANIAIDRTYAGDNTSSLRGRTIHISRHG